MRCGRGSWAALAGRVGRTWRRFLLLVVAKDNTKLTWPLVQGWGIAVYVLPVCTLEASVWVVFVMACRLCGYKIVLVSKTAKSVPTVQLPSHTSLHVGIQLHIKPGEGHSKNDAQRCKIKSVWNSGCQIHIQYRSTRLTAAPHTRHRVSKVTTAHPAGGMHQLPPQKRSPSAEPFRSTCSLAMKSYHCSFSSLTYRCEKL